jgi:cytochrome c oxidase subunit 3
MGGKPPVDRRPTGGGGGGDDWDGNSSGRRGPRNLISSYRLTLLGALIADLMFFLVMVGTYVAGRGIAQASPQGHALLPREAFALPPILWINTALLMASCITMEMARRPLFSEIDVMEEWLGLGRPAGRRSLPWLAVTGVLGLLFVAGQWMAWNQLDAEGVHYATSMNSHFFFLITEAQTFHVMLGITALACCLAGLFLLRKVLWRQILIDCTGWYWQAMGILWLGLFAFLVYGL